MNTSKSVLSWTKHTFLQNENQPQNCRPRSGQTPMFRIPHCHALGQNISTNRDAEKFHRSQLGIKFQISHPTVQNSQFVKNDSCFSNLNQKTIEKSESNPKSCPRAYHCVARCRL